VFFISQDGRLADFYGILGDNFLKDDLLIDHFWPMLIFAGQDIYREEKY
jgi:hypothetical protein